MQLPKNGIYEEGFWVFARALAKPNNSKKDGEPSNIMFVPDPALRVCNDFTFDFDGDGVADECPTPDSDLLALGLVTNKGAYKFTEKGLTRFDEESTSKGKGKSTAKDITGLFTWTGYVCPVSLDVASDPDGPFAGAPDGTIDQFDVPNDQDGDGDIDADDLAIYLAALCEFHNNEWVFNVDDLVVQGQDISNDGVKLVQIRFYPVATTEFTPSTPDVTTEIHRVIDQLHVDVTGGTVDPGTVVHDKAILTAGTGPTPTGRVTFSRFDNGTCSGAPAPDSVEDVDLAGGMAESSDYATLAGVHAISYRVDYDGDNNYLKATGACEPLAVGLSSLVATEIHDLDHHAVTTVAAGTTVHDSATVTGSGPVPTGSVGFTFYIEGACTPSVAEADAGSVAVDGLGLAHPSLPQGPLEAGNYSFKAQYDGDPVYFPAWSTCEPLKVLDIILTQATDTNLPGTFHTVTATVTDGTDPVEGVTVRFEVIAGSLNQGADGQCTNNIECTTDASGEVSFTYPDGNAGPYPGTDTIMACVDIDAVVGTCDSADASSSVVKTWISGP